MTNHTGIHSTVINLTNDDLQKLNGARNLAILLESGAPRTATVDESIPRFAAMIRPLSPELADRLIAAI